MNPSMRWMSHSFPCASRKTKPARRMSAELGSEKSAPALIVSAKRLHSHDEDSEQHPHLGSEGLVDRGIEDAFEDRNHESCSPRGQRLVAGWCRRAWTYSKGSLQVPHVLGNGLPKG